MRRLLLTMMGLVLSVALVTGAAAAMGIWTRASAMAARSQQSSVQL